MFSKVLATWVKSTRIYVTLCEKAKSWEAPGIDLWVHCSLLSTLQTTTPCAEGFSHTVVHIARSTKDFLVFEYADKLAQTLEMLESALAR